MVGQDRADQTSMTLKARIFQPIRTKQLLASTNYFFISLAMLDSLDQTCGNTESLRAITLILHEVRLTWGRLILVWSVALSVFCISLQYQEKFLISWRKKALLISSSLRDEQLGKALERMWIEWQAWRQYSCLHAKQCFTGVIRQEAELSKKRDQEGLREGKRLLFSFFSLPPLFFFLLWYPIPFRASCAVVRKRLFCVLRIRVLPVMCD